MGLAFFLGKYFPPKSLQKIVILYLGRQYQPAKSIVERSRLFHKVDFFGCLSIKWSFVGSDIVMYRPIMYNCVSG